MREVLESALGVECLLCASGGEVRRVTASQRVKLVITGWMLSDGSTWDLCRDLPPGCTHLLVARQAQLQTWEEDGRFSLPAPVSRGDLIGTVRMLLDVGEAEKSRKEEDREVIAKAKQLLMDRNGMTEERAHRFLQKRSMDRCIPMGEVARQVLETGIWV